MCFYSYTKITYKKFQKYENNFYMINKYKIAFGKC